MQYRRILILLFLAALLVAASASDPVHEAVNRLLQSAKPVIRHHEALGLTVFVLLSAVSAMAFFLSSAVIVPVAVYAWGKPAVIFLLWASWLLGAVVSYLIGRRPGRRLAKWALREHHLQRYEKRIAAHATFPVILLFQLAVPSEIPGYVLGALRYHFGRYLGARALAELPFAIGAVYLGDTFLRRQYAPLLAISVGGIILSAAALYLLHKRIDR